MFKEYYPCGYAASVFDIDYERLYALGYRGIIFDLDGTLVPHGANSTPEVDALFRVIHAAGLRTILLTNNDEERVLRFVENIDTLYLCDADKPATSGYLRAVDMLGMKKSEVVYIGDQVFIDMLGANRSGIDSILVHYLLHEGETKLGVKRRLEKLVLWLWRHSRSRHRLRDITKEAKRNVQR
ncbi:MAG: HAD-IIIA family hydrolase [Ruminococcus sp.]|nr:HAD-IIIA family hydrolase [Ruminococcus sp.]